MTKNPRKIWENGVPLSEAIVKFSNFPETGDSPDKRHFRNLGEPAKDGGYDPNNPDFFKYTPKEPWYRKSTRDRYGEKFCEHLCSQLEVGNLIAAGIPDPPEKNRDPEIIPEKLFLQFHRNPNYADWDRDTFAGPTAIYTDVRVFDPRFNFDGTKKKGALPADNLLVPASENSGGRPTKKDLIQEAYRECKSAGKIDFMGSQIEAVQAVRSHIQESMSEDWGDGSGLSEKAVGNHIRRAFNADKSRHRSSKY